MMSGLISTLFALLVVLNFGNAENYCSRELTCRNHKNIMCQAKRTFGPKCRSASVVKMTNRIRNQFLGGHNEKRSLVAQGSLGGFYGPASRMATMIWNSELEKMALQNVLQCKMEHDHCRKTKHFLYAGQNLATRCRTPTYQSVENVVESSMNGWFDEYKLLPAQYLNSYGHGSQPKGMVGHFTQMVRDKAFAVGCAIVKSISYKDKTNWNCYYIACNYATTNMIGQPVYEVGQMAKKCRTGMNKKYPGLCSTKENYYDDKVLFH